MTDMHCHLLYDIDDGAPTIEESKKMLQKFYFENINDIVVTPHYIANSSYNLNNQEKIKRITELEKYIKDENLGINLYIGNEIYITENILEEIKNDNIATINNGKFLLIEFPMDDEFFGLEEVLERLISCGAVPIIAHPERYTLYYNDFSFFENLISMGCILQGNLGSLIGVYGEKSQKMLIEMLRRDMIQIMCTDAHRSNSRVLEKMGEIKEILFKLVGQQRFIELTETNMKYILNQN